jgi:hypothetical protein
LGRPEGTQLRNNYCRCPSRPDRLAPRLAGSGIIRRSRSSPEADAASMLGRLRGRAVGPAMRRPISSLSRGTIKQQLYRRSAGEMENLLEDDGTEATRAIRWAKFEQVRQLSEQGLSTIAIYRATRLHLRTVKAWHRASALGHHDLQSRSGRDRCSGLDQPRLRPGHWRGSSPPVPIEDMLEVERLRAWLAVGLHHLFSIYFPLSLAAV